MLREVTFAQWASLAKFTQPHELRVPSNLRHEFPDGV